MARTLRDASLETRAARSRLKARGKPHYRAIEEGLHLGYRKAKGRPGKPAVAGKWVVRLYQGKQDYTVETIAAADDFSDADGVAVLDFKQAQQAARERLVRHAHAAAGKTGPFTVAQAMDAYIEFLETNRKSAGDARYRDNAFIRPSLGSEEVENLTADQIRKWHVALAKAPARLRTKKGKAQKHREANRDEEAVRRRRSTANRTLTVLKAAFNRAWKEGEVASDAAWRRVEPFEDVDAARIRYLTVAEAKRLINAADSEFRPLVLAALQTGARYGELIRLEVRDFNPDAGTIAVRQSKSGKPRHVVLTDEGAALFKQLTAGRPAGELLIRKEDGSAWKKSHQARPIAEACKNAKVTPPINFHALRHTYASHAVMNGAPLLVVAKNLGHSDTRMVEKHYGHLASSFIAEAIRAAAPRFGIKSSNVRSLG